MVRTQVYLTRKERDGLSALSRASGKKQSELIREAVDHLLSQSAPQERLKAVKAAAGMWKDRDDLPDFAAIRAEWDR